MEDSDNTTVGSDTGEQPTTTDSTQPGDDSGYVTDGAGGKEMPSPSIVDPDEPLTSDDEDDPIPPPDEEHLPEPRQVQHSITNDLVSAFEAGAGPFDWTPEASDFESDPWFDFSYLDQYDEVERSWVDKPYAYVSVLYDPAEDEYLYHVNAPTLDEFEEYVRRDLQGVLRDVLMYKQVDRERPDREVVTEAVRELLAEYTGRVEWASLTKVYYYLVRDFVGTGKIDPLMRDSAIEDISCVGANIPIFIYHGTYRDLRTNISFEAERLRTVVSRMAARAGNHISVSNPLLDATMPDGSRVQLTLGSEVSTRGSNFTIRKFADIPHTPIDLINWNTYPLDAMAFLWLAIQNDMSMLFAGGTASGKTTSMNAASFFIPPNSKVVSIEDTREITLPHDNWIQSVSRKSFSRDSAADIGTHDLLQSGLRQRPEYLLVGEIRTEQDVALTFFQAIATGHTGYSTFHADSVESTLDRLRNPPLSVADQLLRGLDLVAVQKQQFLGDRRVRRVTEITEVSRDGNDISLNPLFSWNPTDDSFEYHGSSRIKNRICAARGWSTEEFERQLNARRVVLGYLVENEITEYQAVANAIHSFARRPDEIMQAIQDGVYQPGV